MDKDNNRKSYIANNDIEDALKNDSKVRTHGMYNVEAAPLVINEEPEKKQQ
ncbi:hypothetical protein J9317_11205 [Metabacillus sp. KIGAM252]|uniref:Uncharacterized protein n=1 Tax=Metabacillus flavus TaxID=2823519 RepID=A0ABS5LFN6_9BACI|nr:hypothetical protein [Metabacillus flavus]MBS2969333.1 hypothetical protein [Metabacillus flavus]